MIEPQRPKACYNLQGACNEDCLQSFWLRLSQNFQDFLGKKTEFLHGDLDQGASCSQPVDSLDGPCCLHALPVSSASVDEWQQWHRDSDHAFALPVSMISLRQSCMFLGFQSLVCETSASLQGTREQHSLSFLPNPGLPVTVQNLQIASLVKSKL